MVDSVESTTGLVAPAGPQTANLPDNSTTLTDVDLGKSRLIQSFLRHETLS